MKLEIRDQKPEENISFWLTKNDRGEIHLVGTGPDDKEGYGFIVAVVQPDLTVYIHPLGSAGLGLKVRGSK